jgi:glycine/D-amino acid oxidase-like deaminating enzyme
VVVLGAGIAGCLAALRLARAGARVALLEARTPGGGATGRSAGFLILGTADHPDRTAAALGAERALAVWDYVEQSLAGLVALLGEDRAACGVRLDGGLVLAADAEEADSLAKSLALLGGRRNLGELWTAAEVERRTGFVGFSGGWFRPGDGMVEPVALCRALAARAEALGATVVSGVRAAAIDEAPRGGPLIVQTDRGTVLAEQVLLAVNAGLPALVPPLAAAVVPVRAQMHSTAPVTDVPRLPWPVYAHHGYEYWRQQAGGELLFGGCRLAVGPAAERGVTDDESISEVVFAAQRAFVARHLPAFAQAPVTARWSGIMAFTPDGLPVVGRVPGSARQWVCAACNGHGLALSPRSVELVVAAMLDTRRERELPAMFAPGRCAPTGGP